MSMLSDQAKQLRDTADRLDRIANVSTPWIHAKLVPMLREAADTIISLRDRLQEIDETCSIEWRGESYDTDAGREHDGAYFCTKCRADLPYPLQECWDDYQVLVADYGNIPPWNEKPFLHCPNCGRKVVDE